MGQKLKPQKGQYCQDCDNRRRCWDHNWCHKPKKDGIQQASQHSGEEWKDYATRFVQSYLQQHPELFTDDLWEAGLKRPESPRALGAVMQEAIKSGWMQEQTHDGKILARESKASNMQLKRVWKSNLCKK